MKAYDDLMAHVRETQALNEVAGRLGWDQETVMPEGAAEQRGEEMGAMAGVLHARNTDPKIGEWLAACEGQVTDEVGKAQLRLIRRRYDRMVKVPARLASEIARATSTGQGIWARARAANDTAAFMPTLAKIIALKVEEADALREGTNKDRYDAMLDDYEPEATQELLTTMFDELRPRLTKLRDRVMGASHQPKPLTGTYSEEGQLALSKELAVTFGYDLNHGRIDKAVHPFSSGSGLDVRITTRTNLSDPFNCFYSTIHEVGHAAYEQAIDRAYLLTPVGGGVSMGVHESQSRSYENQIGRSRAFAGHVFSRMKAVFGDFGVANADDFHGAMNRVTPGYIRTESDEVQYNLHVLLRYDIERALVKGDLTTDDLPGAWNDRFERDFGVKVDKPANGCLQDVHWSGGALGYFPTYTLGNVYAGCLMEALRRDLPDLDASLAKGDTSPATGWMKDHLQQYGGLRGPVETIRHATGKAPSEGPLLDYLEAKFERIYKL